MATIEEILASFAPNEAERKAARSQALMVAGLGLLGTPKGQEWRGLGRAGLLGIGDYNEQLAQGAEQKMRNMQLAQTVMRMQQEEEQRRSEQQRQQAFAKARGDSMIPGTPGLPQMGPPTAQGEMQAGIAPGAPKFDLAGYANRVMPLDFGEAAKALTLQKQLAPENPFGKIDPKDYTAESLAEFRRTNDPTVLRSHPKEVQTKVMNDGRSQWLVNAATGEQVGPKIPVQMSLADAGRLSLDWAKYNQEKNKPEAPGQIVETGQGFVRIGKDNSVTPITVGGTALQGKPTGAVQQQIASNQVTLGKIDRAAALVDKHPNAFGVQNFAGDLVMQRVDPAGVEARAMIADIAGQKIHDRSGAAVTVGEAQRLKPYVPNPTDNAATVKKKLALFKQEYIAMQNELTGGKLLAEVDQPVAAQPTTPNVVDLRKKYGL